MTFRRTSDRNELVLYGLTLLLISVYYAFVVSAGTFQTVDWNTDYYDLLAQGFHNGHLYVPVKPNPRLLRRVDPYSYRNSGLWLWDATLYGGKYYMYWGPVPALCVWAFKFITHYRDTIYDQTLVLAFAIGRLCAWIALLLSFVSAPGAYRPPRWAVITAIVVFGLASPTPYFIARPLVYEASVAAGQCFVLWGLVAAFWGLRLRRHRVALFALAGTCWSFGAASRGSQLLAIPPLILVTAWIGERGAFDFRSLLRSLFALGIPVALMAASYAVYNQERFGDPLEFGLRYQLTERPFVGHLRHILPNIYSYLNAELKWSCHFPYVRLPKNRVLWSGIEWAADYDPGDWDKGERVAGVLRATVWCYLLLAWPARIALGVRRLAVRGPAARAISLSNAELWLLSCSLCMMATMASVAGMYMANMRFLEDGAAGLLIASTLGGFWLLRQSERSAPGRALASAVYLALGLYTVFIGLGLGFTGHYNNFETQNPALFHELVDKLSVCKHH